MWGFRTPSRAPPDMRRGWGASPRYTAGMRFPILLALLLSTLACDLLLPPPATQERRRRSSGEGEGEVACTDNGDCRGGEVCEDDLDCQLSAAECTVDDDCPADCDRDATPCPPESVLAPRCVAHRGRGRCAVAPSASGACRQAEDIEDIDIVIAVVTTDGVNVDVCAEDGFCAEPGTSQAGCFQ